MRVQSLIVVLEFHTVHRGSVREEVPIFRDYVVLLAFPLSGMLSSLVVWLCRRGE